MAKQLTNNPKLDEALGGYRVPTSPDKLFFDFYALYTISYRFGKMWNAYHASSNPNAPTYAKVEQYIDEAFESVTDKIKTIMLQWVPMVCLSETLNLNYTKECDPELVYSWLLSKGYVTALDGKTKLRDINQSTPWMEEFTEERIPNNASKHLIAQLLALILSRSAISGNGAVMFDAESITTEDLRKFIDRHHPTIHQIQDVFLLDWTEMFGGSQWFYISGLIKKLADAKRPKDVVFYIDQLYDVEHNTGTLLSKIPPLYVPTQMLDVRAELRDPRDFMPYVSSECRRLLLSVSRALHLDIVQRGGDDAPPTKMIVRPVLNQFKIVEPLDMEIAVLVGTSTEIELPENVLKTLWSYIQKLGNDTLFAVTNKDVSYANRFIPLALDKLPLVASVENDQYILHAPGMAFDGQRWPSTAFEKISDIREAQDILKVELTLLQNG